jgi:hypothetical protein
MDKMLEKNCDHAVTMDWTHFRRETSRHSQKGFYFFHIPEKVSEDIWLLRSEPCMGRYFKAILKR